jgi:hypothetical protein
LEFATRAAKVLARRTGMPVYLGCSVQLGEIGGGTGVDEEVQAFRGVVEAVVGEWEGWKKSSGPGGMVNGV